MTLANYLTLSRIFFIPVFSVFMYMDQNWSYVVSAAIFSIAAITDWADGYLARTRNEETAFGAFLDPVADKLMVVIALVLIVIKYPSIAITLASIIIIARELVVSSLREWMAQSGKRDIVAVSNIGKWKTTMQIIAIIGLCLFKPTFEFAGLSYGLWGFYLASVFLYLAAVFSLWSMWLYLHVAFISK